MNGHFLIFGPGYVATRLAARLAAEGWLVSAVARSPRADQIGFDDAPAVQNAIAVATHVLSSVPPAEHVDPVLDRFATAVATTPARWCGYLSSTGVYGDTGGAWVDESAPVGSGRRSARAVADAAWLALRPDARVFRLPGIYGPGRSPIDRVREGKAHRVDMPDQVFSRVHVDDIVAGVIASFYRGGPGTYNLADDLPCAQTLVIEEAARLAGLPPPPFVSLGSLSPMARGFYAENRQVANGKAKRLLGWSPAYPTFREGLRALSATTSPASASTTPAAASGVQR